MIVKEPICVVLSKGTMQFLIQQLQWWLHAGLDAVCGGIGEMVTERKTDVLISLDYSRAKVFITLNNEKL